MGRGLDGAGPGPDREGVGTLRSSVHVKTSTTLWGRRQRSLTLTTWETITHGRREGPTPDSSGLELVPGSKIVFESLGTRRCPARVTDSDQGVILG